MMMNRIRSFLIPSKTDGLEALAEDGNAEPLVCEPHIGLQSQRRRG